MLKGKKHKKNKKLIWNKTDVTLTPDLNLKVEEIF